MAALEEFAVAVVGQDRRISLILHLSPDISLDMANSTRTPYLIAGHYEGGEATFMCPAVGSNEAILQGFCCVVRNHDSEGFSFAKINLWTK